jgi:hypothetical protein
MVPHFGVRFLIASTVNDTVVHSFYSSEKIWLLVVLLLTIVKNIFDVLTI